MRWTLLVGIVCYLTDPLSAQTVPSATGYLATATSDPSLVAARTKVDFLSSTDHRLPFAQELEFRTETHDFLLDEQEYTLRFSPNVPAQQRRQADYHRAVVELARARDRPLLMKALVPKYRSVVDYHFLPKLLESQRQTLALYRRQLQLLRRQVVTDDFDLDDLVATEFDIFEMEEKLLERSQMWRSVREEIGSVFPNDSITTDFLTIEAIESRMDSYPPPPALEEEILRLRNELLLADYQRELAAINNPLDFIQARYGGRNSDAFREEFAVGLGLRFPIKGDKKLDLLEIEYEQRERTADHQIEMLERERKISEAATTVLFHLERYRLLNRQYADTQTEYALKRLEQLADADPLQIVQFQLILQKRQQRVLELRYRIYRDFVEWLEVSERLTAPPLRNWLSPGMENF